MTEAEWLAGVDPGPLLEVWRPTATERQLRLFALACCARIDHLITDPRSRAVVDFVARNVDGSPNRRKDRQAVANAAQEARQEVVERMAPGQGKVRWRVLAASNAADAARATVDTDPWFAARDAAYFSASAVGWSALAVSAVDDTVADLELSVTRGEQEYLARLLRDIAGNPFRPRTVDRRWLAMRGGVRQLATALYDERRFAEVPVLGDALEDAGCTEEAILAHCRTPGPHVRGCWVVDALLAKT